MFTHVLENPTSFNFLRDQLLNISVFRELLIKFLIELAKINKVAAYFVSFGEIGGLHTHKCVKISGNLAKI